VRATGSNLEIEPLQLAQGGTATLRGRCVAVKRFVSDCWCLEKHAAAA
jgi:hypothetical protein